MQHEVKYKLPDSGADLTLTFDGNVLALSRREREFFCAITDRFQAGVKEEVLLAPAVRRGRPPGSLNRKKEKEREAEGANRLAAIVPMDRS